WGGRAGTPQGALVFGRRLCPAEVGAKWPQWGPVPLALFPARIVFFSVAVARLLRPPPILPAVLSVIVTLVNASEPLMFSMPPPSVVAVFPLMVTFVAVTVPALS